MTKKATNPQNLQPERRPVGRPKGVKNKLSGTVKEHVVQVWEMLQGDKVTALHTVASANPEWFYGTFGRALIPKQLELDARFSGSLTANLHVLSDEELLKIATSGSSKDSLPA